MPIFGREKRDFDLSEAQTTLALSSNFTKVICNRNTLSLGSTLASFENLPAEVVLRGTFCAISLRFTKEIKIANSKQLRQICDRMSLLLQALISKVKHNRNT